MAEEQAGFRAGRSTTNKSSIYESSMRNTLRTTEKHHNFIDFTKVFDRVWDQRLWALLRKYNISKSLINCIESLDQDAKVFDRVWHQRSDV